jgi:hypothetical protein
MTDFLSLGAITLSAIAVVVTSVAGASELQQGNPTVAAFLLSLTVLNAIMFAVNVNYVWR